jgi:hypothetical protein
VVSTCWIQVRAVVGKASWAVVAVEAALHWPPFAKLVARASTMGLPLHVKSSALNCCVQVPPAHLPPSVQRPVPASIMLPALLQGAPSAAVPGTHERPLALALDVFVTPAEYLPSLVWQPLLSGEAVQLQPYPTGGLLIVAPPTVTGAKAAYGPHSLFFWIKERRPVPTQRLPVNLVRASACDFVELAIMTVHVDDGANWDCFSVLIATGDEKCWTIVYLVVHPDDHMNQHTHTNTQTHKDAHNVQLETTV